MNNMWPVIQDIKSTDDVMPFFEETIKSLKDNYDGKINAQICKIEYILKSSKSVLSSFHDMSKLIDPQVEEDSFEEKIDIEKDRKLAYVNNYDYKYEIYNDHLYFKLFTINIPEFYPLKIHVSAGLLDKDDVEINIYDIDKLKNVFSEIVCSNKARMIIMKMMK